MTVIATKRSRAAGLFDREGAVYGPLVIRTLFCHPRRLDLGLLFGVMHFRLAESSSKISKAPYAHRERA